MNLWCPDCGSTSFFYNTVEKEEDKQEGMTIVTDHMKCKKCNKEFNIKWYEYIRNSWLENQPKSFKRK
jgi:hypothetical protein